MTILVTGAAGFIGFHVCKALLARGERVLGIDNLNDYYDVRLKEARLALLQAHESFAFARADISDREATAAAIEPERESIARIVHLAAQAGVRHSLVDPYAYVQANVMGQVVILELCRSLPQLEHIVYASSSSVYGGLAEAPFAVDARVDTPISLYAATKKAGELIGHVYGHLFAVPATGLRFFTVYGPWGRPDMAAFLFTRAILEGRPITLFNHGRMKRDFTYIDDVVPAVLSVLDAPPAGGWRRSPPHLQRRQQPARGSDRLCRRPGAGHRPQGGDRACADAARRRGGDLGRYLGAATRSRLRAEDHDRRGNPALRRLVPRPLRRLTAPFLLWDWTLGASPSLTGSRQAATAARNAPPSRARARGRGRGVRAESKDYRLP